MSVIYSFPKWRVFCHEDKDGVNTIRKWLNENGVSIAMRSTLQSFIDILESAGPHAIQGAIVSIGEKDGLEALKGSRAGEPHVFLIFRRNIFTQNEITLLEGSLNPKKERQEALRKLREVETTQRRKRERLT